MPGMRFVLRAEHSPRAANRLQRLRRTSLRNLKSGITRRHSGNDEEDSRRPSADDATNKRRGSESFRRGSRVASIMIPPQLVLSPAGEDVPQRVVVEDAPTEMTAIGKRSNSLEEPSVLNQSARHSLAGSVAVANMRFRRRITMLDDFDDEEEKPKEEDDFQDAMSEDRTAAPHAGVENAAGGASNEQPPQIDIPIPLPTVMIEVPTNGVVESMGGDSV